jgi:hypothetical protein
MIVINIIFNRGSPFILGLTLFFIFSVSICNAQVSYKYIYQPENSDTLFNYQLKIYRSNEIVTIQSSDEGRFLFTKEKFVPADSIVVFSAFGSARLPLNYQDKIFIPVTFKDSLDQITLLSKEIEQFEKKTHGTSLGCKHFWNPGRHMIAISRDSLRGNYITSVAIKLRKAKKDDFGNKLKNKKRLGIRIQSIDSIQKSFDNDLVQVEVFMVENNESGWFEINFKENPVFLDDSSFIGKGFDFYDYGFVTPCHDRGNKNNADFIPLKQIKITEQGKLIDSWWEPLDNYQNYDDEILPIKIITKG